MQNELVIVIIPKRHFHHVIVLVIVMKKLGVDKIFVIILVDEYNTVGNEQYIRSQMIGYRQGHR